jgi:hypothetical protein
LFFKRKKKKTYKDIDDEFPLKKLKDLLPVKHAERSVAGYGKIAGKVYLVLHQPGTIAGEQAESLIVSRVLALRDAGKDVVVINVEELYLDHQVPELYSLIPHARLKLQFLVPRVLKIIPSSDGQNWFPVVGSCHTDPRILDLKLINWLLEGEQSRKG